MLDSIAHHVRAGASLHHAFERATDDHPVDGSVIRSNCSLLHALGNTSSDPDEAVVLHSLTVAHALGGPVSSGLQAGVSVLRERAAIRADIAVHSAQARLSARVLTAVPVVFCIWGIGASRSFRAAVGTPVGVTATILGVALNVAGWVAMRFIIDRVGR
jgi:Flp pilus assembly protein TadB